jgi:hypothetical protein
LFVFEVLFTTLRVVTRPAWLMFKSRIGRKRNECT